MVGRTLGHYRVLDTLGKGGMGEVYRAHDEVLGREVAIKVLPEELSTDPERLARFEREAKVLAALNHPHIGAIYGLEKDDGQHFLVLELIEGETLAERIERGPIPVSEAVPLAIQIAEGLEAAHEKGMIHRDLKPANIKITPEGEVKVLDFGLAKPTEAVFSGDLSESPTLTYSPTGVGVILGTAAYMSPEQVRGKEVDRRTDVWAFGVVLWEMLTGKKLFQGDTVSDVLAATLTREPHWEWLPTTLPTGVTRVLRHCLVQEPKERLRDIADARIDLQEVFDEPEIEVAVSAEALPLWRRALPWAAVLLALAAGWLLRPTPEPEPLPVVRSEIPLPEGERLTHTQRHGLALSPDGSILAFVSGIPLDSLWPERTQIFLRNLDGWQARPIPGTENTGQPIFSPDGQWLAFLAIEPDRLRKVPVSGGEPETICECDARFGVTWGPDNTIVFADFGGALQQVSALGGSPELLIEPPRDTDATNFYRLPHFLPASDTLLYSSFPSVFPFSATIFAYSMVTGESTKVMDDGMDARYVESGHLVFARRGQLVAARFDPVRLEVLGPEVPILEEVSQSQFINASFLNTGAAQFSVSATGLLAFAEGSVMPEAKTTPVVVDQAGSSTELDLEEKDYSKARVSMDGRFVLLGTSYQPWAIWLFDTERGGLSRETFEKSAYPLWGPGEGEFTYATREGEDQGLYIKKLGSGQGLGEQLIAGQGWEPTSWSPDGKYLAALKAEQDTEYDIWILGKDGSAELFLKSVFYETDPEFSPDGQWLLYSSDESGRLEVYVRPFPGPGSAVQVSVAGGSAPCWSRDGRQIFYREGAKFFSVEIHEQNGTLTAARPKELFEGRYYRTLPVRSYDITPGGSFLLIPLPSREAQDSLIEVLMPDRIQLVQNWFTELQEKAPR